MGNRNAKQQTNVDDAKLIFVTQRGDPVSSIIINDRGCSAGTLFGTVWAYLFQDGPHARRKIHLAGFSDEAIRGLTIDQSSVFATVGDLHCRKWRVNSDSGPSPPQHMKFDRKMEATSKFVLQRYRKVLILLPGHSLYVDLFLEKQEPLGFRLILNGAVAPVDFDGDRLLCVEHSEDASPTARVYDVRKDQLLGDVLLPNKGVRCTQAKLWGETCIAMVSKGVDIHIFNFTTKKCQQILKGHPKEIVSLNCMDANRIFSMDKSGQFRMWDGHDGLTLLTYQCLECSFHLGFPYYIMADGFRVVFSADEGVFLKEFSPEEFSFPMRDRNTVV